MKYDIRTSRLWARLHGIAKEQGLRMEELDARLCLAPGTLEVMEEYGIIPEGEVLVRLRRYLGARAADMTRADESTLPLETSRDLFILHEIKPEEMLYSPENIADKKIIECDPDDDREYVGWIARDDSMRLARINKGDMVVVRRQGIAQNGEIVLISLDGETVLRRYFRFKDLVWAETAGRANDGKHLVIENIHEPSPRIKVWGKVISVMHVFN